MDNKLAVTGCVAVTKVGAKCPLFPPPASAKSDITSQLLTKMADMETKLHVALV